MDEDAKGAVTKKFLSTIKARDSRFVKNERMLIDGNFKMKFPNPKNCSPALRDIYDAIKGNITVDDLEQLHEGITSSPNLLDTFFKI
jgi:hypothetical protein